MSEPELVHLVVESSQPSVQILCTEVWDRAGWGEEAYVRRDLGLGGGIYRTEGGQQYCFADAVTTCPVCIEKRLAQHRAYTARIRERTQAYLESTEKPKITFNK